MIDTPFPSKSDAVLQAPIGADGGPSYIWFDLRDGSDARDAHPGVHIRVSGINKAAKGQKIGVWFYRQIVDWADRQGLPTYSDHISVSPEAQRMYKALERRGYRVERLAETFRDEEGYLISEDLTTPVYRVSVRDPAAITEERTGAPLPRDDYQIDGPTLRERQQAVDEQRARQEEYDKLSGAEAAIRDNPDTPLFSFGSGRRRLNARDLLEQARLESEAAREMRKGFEAAARCAARHGASNAVRASAITMGWTPMAALDAQIGHALGMVYALPVGLTVTPILARQVASDKRRVERAASIARATELGLDEPSIDPAAPESGERVSDLAMQAGDDIGYIDEPLSPDIPEEDEGIVKPGQAVP